MTRPRTMPFLINPPRRSTTTMATKKRGKRRNPPKGFRSWKAYMASIRPGAKKRKARARTRSNPAGGHTVARKTRKRRKATTHHAVARRRHSSRSHAHSAPRRRRYRRNPPSVLRTLPSFIMGAGFGALCATGGKLAGRKGSALLKQTPGTVVSMATQGLIGIVAGLLVAMKFPTAGRDVALGGIQAPLETGLSRLKLPILSDLGADDYYLGFGDGMGGYVAGNIPPAQLGEYTQGAGGGFVAA